MFPRKNQPEQDTVEAPQVDSRFLDRLERFEQLGFDVYQAEQLANARDRAGRHLWPGEIAKALSKGCTLEQAVAIYT